jgi:hypothetical protein
LLTATRSFALACVAAFGLIACGGGGSSSPTPPKSPAGQQKKVQSVPCTPDSYGYCFVQTYHHSTLIRCSQFVAYTEGENDYEVYDSTTDLGTYVETWTANCLDTTTEFTWNPSEPSQTYSDPNLP